MRYEVLVPSAMYESESVLDLDRAHDICYDLAEEHGYAEIRLNGHHIADYGNPAAFLWHLRGCPLSPPFPLSTHYTRGVEGRETHQNQHFSSNMTKVFNREELIEKYAYQIMEGMDMKTMECFVIDCLTDNLNSYSDEELITEVEEYNPELLEE